MASIVIIIIIIILALQSYTDPPPSFSAQRPANKDVSSEICLALSLVSPLPPVAVAICPAITRGSSPDLLRPSPHLHLIL